MCQLQHLLREQSGRRVKLALVGGRQGEWHYHPFMFFQHQFEPVARLVPIMSTILGKDLPARVCILQNRRVSTSRIPAGRTLGSHTITPYPRNMAHFPHCFCRFVLPLYPEGNSCHSSAWWQMSSRTVFWEPLELSRLSIRQRRPFQISLAHHLLPEPTLCRASRTSHIDLDTFRAHLPAEGALL